MNQIILSLGLFSISLAISIFAFVYPIIISNRSHIDIKNTQLEITKLVTGINTMINNINNDNKDIIHKIINSSLNQSNLKAADKEKLRISFNQLISDPEIKGLTTIPTIDELVNKYYDSKKILSENSSIKPNPSASVSPSVEPDPSPTPSPEDK